MTDYDATAHISEEVRRAAYAGMPCVPLSLQVTYLSLIQRRLQYSLQVRPSISPFFWDFNEHKIQLVIGTGLFGWLLNIVLILCSGPLQNLPGPSGSAFLTILALRLGKGGSLFLWTLVCFTAFFVVQTALQAASRTVYAFSRDHGFPDRGYFGEMAKWSDTPLRAIWGTTIVSILPGLLDLASPVAAGAIFSLTAMALDLSYIIPIFLYVYSFPFHSLN
jgi:amino acid transporter